MLNVTVLTDDAIIIHPLCFHKSQELADTRSGIDCVSGKSVKRKGGYYPQSDGMERADNRQAL